MQVYTKSELTTMKQAAIETLTSEILGKKVGRASNKEDAIKRYLKAVDGDQRERDKSDKQKEGPAPKRTTPRRVADGTRPLHRKVFTLTIDDIEATGIKRKLGNMRTLARAVAEVWFKHGKKTMTGAEMEVFLEKHRDKFPRVKQTMIRVFQDLMTELGDGPRGQNLVTRINGSEASGA